MTQKKTTQLDRLVSDAETIVRLVGHIKGLRKQLGDVSRQARAQAKQLKEFNENHARYREEIQRLNWERDQLKRHVANWRDVLGISDEPLLAQETDDE